MCVDLQQVVADLKKLQTAVSSEETAKSLNTALTVEEQVASGRGTSFMSTMVCAVTCSGLCWFVVKQHLICFFLVLFFFDV
jgi:hypothetical protein